MVSATEDALVNADFGMIASHRRHGLADGEQWIAQRLIRTEPGSTAHCVPRTLQGTVSIIDGGPIRPSVSQGYEKI